MYCLNPSLAKANGSSKTVLSHVDSYPVLEVLKRSRSPRPRRQNAGGLTPTKLMTPTNLSGNTP